MPPPQDEGVGRERPPRIRPYLGVPAAPEPLPDPRGLAEAEEQVAAGLRPFVLTSGRVTGSEDIGLHTQVTARVDESATYGLPRELQAIVALCAEPMSVAEISARLRMHLGVTKILVGDLRAAGYLDVHVLDLSTPHDPDTILRVIDGLRAFS
jgi:hypothetical protein